MSATLYYVHDPMCSWCWGYRSSWEALKAELPASVSVRYLVGGLAPDCDEPMPLALRVKIKAIWHQIQDLLGTEFNFDFWTANTPRRSTFIACRAVLAAGKQQAGEAMMKAIQEAYYLRAMNPSNRHILVELAGELNLDTVAFAAELDSSDNQAEFAHEREKAMRFGINGFPSLVLESDNGFRLIDIDYQDHRVSLAQILGEGRRAENCGTVAQPG